MVNAASGASTRWPLSTWRSASTFSAGQSLRLASVCLRTRFPSRQPRRSRIAGRELRLGTVSMYMGTTVDDLSHVVNMKSIIYMGTSFAAWCAVFRSNSIGYCARQSLVMEDAM